MGIKIVWAESVFILSAILLAVVLYSRIWLRPSRLRSLSIRLCISAFGILIPFLGLELYAFHFLAQSDSFGFTLASRRWSELYWNPINSMGFRDVEHHPDAMGARKVLLLLGDSLVAGMGTSDYRKRFANVLQSRLGEEWEVVILARNGWDTNDELNALKSSPFKPSSIALSYYINDIEGAAHKRGVDRPTLIQSPAPWVGLFVNHSYVLNFLYWRVYRFRNASELGRIYTDYVTRCYSDEAIWKTHEEELKEIADFAERQTAPLHVLVIPRLTDKIGRAHV